MTLRTAAVVPPMVLAEEPPSTRMPTVLLNPPFWMRIVFADIHCGQPMDRLATTAARLSPFATSIR